MPSPESLEVARITRTTLGKGEQHRGMMSSGLYLEGNHWGQVFGGWRLDRYDKEISKGVADAALGIWVAGVLRVAEVDDWSELPGKFVRIQRENGTITRIYHILDDAIYFDPKEEFSANTGGDN